MNTKEWKVVPVQCGPGQFFVLVDNKDHTRAQGRRELCEAVKASHKHNDTAAQRSERFGFYGVWI